MYRTLNIADVQNRLDGFAFNQLMSLIKKKRNQSGFSWAIEGEKCVIVGPSAPKSFLELTIWQILNRTKRRKKPPTKFTFIFTT